MSVLHRSCRARWSSIVATLAIVATTALPTAAAEPAAQPVEGATAPIARDPAAGEPTTTAAEHEQLVAEGERLVAANEPAAGAERFSSAYLSMPAALRVSDVGRHAVVSACNAYESAWQATADQAHLEANGALLATYLADLETARAAGQATSPADEHEVALRERAEAISALIAQPQPQPQPSEPVPSPAIDPATAEPQVELTFPPPDPRLRRNALILVGAGATGAVVGGIMVIIGAVGASRAEQARQGLPADEAGDARSRKVAGAIVATTGALLFSGSMIMVGAGTNRLAELRRELALTLRPTRGGVVLRGRF